ncbi:MAG TPA: HAMP domain-containing sensor histidine kinase [Bacteroidia bacterium]|nr:HAMP domain-containing sensor histidine kinase [Bacteroidia bacterium]
MKLTSKSILYYLVISLPLLITACLFSYYLIRSELRDGTDEILGREKLSAEKLINSSANLNALTLLPDSFFTVRVTPYHVDSQQYTDTTMYDKVDNELKNYRVSKSFYNHNKITYLISILKPTLEEDELAEGLLSSLFLVVFFLLLSFLLVNWILSKWIWKPFYKTLSTLHKYELKKNELLILNPSNTKEFNELNDALIKMTDKIYSDYIRQKEFTENASHEIQTPLAVIRSKIELLIQSENLKEDEMLQIQTIETAANKLSTLNKALLLLVKIENHQFKEASELSLKTHIETILAQFDWVLTDKNIQLKTEFKNDLLFKINPELLDILLANLLQNAIRHNFRNGSVEVKIIGHTLRITNTGDALKIKPEELFERFKKDTTKTESLGIGLAIVKGIIDIYNIDIKYFYKEKCHVFELIFPPKD